MNELKKIPMPNTVIARKTPKNNEILKKEIRYKAEHRGSKEADVLLGRFCAFFMPQATEEELYLLRDLVSQNDEDAFAILQSEAAPYQSIAAYYRLFKSNPHGLMGPGNPWEDNQ